MKPDRFSYRRAARVVLAAASILMLPFLAMQVSEHVDWGLADFALAGALLVGTGLLYLFAVSRSGTPAYRAAVGLALGSALLLIWSNLAVGIIGEPEEPANAMYFGVVAVGLVGTALARFQPQRMALALLATALAQAVVTAIVLTVGSGPRSSGPLEILVLNGFFVALFIGSAVLFRAAARQETLPGAGSPG